MKNWNTVNARKPIVAAFSGHFHELLGHFPQKLTGMYTTSASWPRPFYDDFPADRPVRHFLTGSLAHQGFLSLKMYDHHSNFDDRYFEVWAHTRNPTTKEWEKECTNVLGKTASDRAGGYCTKFYFNGNVLDYTPYDYLSN